MDTMVQSIDNLTALTGRVAEIGPHPRLAGWDRVLMDVLDAGPVPGRADLLSRRAGERLELAVRHDLLGNAAPGATLRLRAKLSSGEVIAEPHPDEGDFTVRPP
ncbi:hypothetical protein [Actinomadura rugatobispora]|uniref:Uncharacterized protein n=1 Tax=Actinomadura rugatobispora TaxID=1994 RepID=A0ABW1A4A3_9ACTN|nr:hypothetical protein GCM10010200_018360 [Actinomadura rugatobispora]